MGSFFRSLILADNPALYWRLGESSGTNGRITSSYNPFQNGGVVVFEGWSFRDAAADNDCLIGSASATAGTWVRLHVTGVPNDNVRFTVDGATNDVVWSGVWPGTGKWVYWALRFDEPNDLAELFVGDAVNGAESKGLKTVAQQFSADAGNFVVGARSGTNDPFDGRMGEIAVYDHDVPASHLLTHYARGAHSFHTPATTVAR